jgi:hypothetical protein
VGTGSREENASNQKARARLRFNQKLTRSKAFSSEVGAGSREESASNQKARARLRFNQKLTRSSPIQP